VKRGFTLTELLIGLAIIGVISGLAIPMVRGAKAKAHQAACIQKLRSLGVAVEGYTQDHGGLYPPLEMGRVSSEAGEDDLVLETVLLEYAGGDESSFHCPADNEHFKKTNSSYFWNHQLSGLPKVKVTLLGMDSGLETIPLITDKEAFHGDTNGTNFLYADQSASQKVKFDVGSR